MRDAARQVDERALLADGETARHSTDERDALDRHHAEGERHVLRLAGQRLLHKPHAGADCTWRRARHSRRKDRKQRRTGQPHCRSLPAGGRVAKAHTEPVQLRYQQVEHERKERHDDAHEEKATAEEHGLGDDALAEAHPRCQAAWLERRATAAVATIFQRAVDADVGDSRRSLGR